MEKLLLKNTWYTNSVVAAVLLCVPVVVAIVARLTGNSSINGIDMLLYWPFDFAYLLVAMAIFLMVNAGLARNLGRSTLVGIGIGALFGVCWFVLSFLLIAQLHLSLGGQM